MTWTIEISGLSTRQGEPATAICILQLEQAIDRDGLSQLVRRLGSVVGPEGEEMLDSLPEELDQDPRLVMLPWSPPGPDGLELQRAALEEAAEVERIEKAWFFQVGTSVARRDEEFEDEEDEDEEFEDEEDEDEEDEETEAWSNGPPPLQAEVPFPVDGYPEIIEEFDWYDFGIAVKLGKPHLPGEDAVLASFHALWLMPCLGCFRNTDVTIDHDHRAVHFWVDRYTVPLSSEQSVHHLLWIVARLNEVIPVVHATFHPASMDQKYGGLLGEVGEPFVLAGNPLALVHRRGGPDAVAQWRREQPHWSAEEIARMLQQTAIGVLVGAEDEQAEDEQAEDEQAEGEQAEGEQAEDEQAEDEQAEDEQAEASLDPGRAAEALRLLRDALELAPSDDEIQYTCGRVLLSADRTDELLAAMATFEVGTRLQLTNELGQRGPSGFTAALEMVLDEPLPERLLMESDASCGGGGASVSSFGDQSAELIAELARHTATHAPDRLETLLPLLPAEVETLATVAHELGQGGHREQTVAVYQRMLSLPPPEHGTPARSSYCRAFNNACIRAHEAQDYALAVEIADRAQPYVHENPFICHSAACAYAAVGDLDRAFEQVELAVDHDYPYLAPKSGQQSDSYLESDSDLGQLPESARFKDLFARWRAARPSFIEGTEALQNEDAEAAIPLLRQASGADSPLARKALINLGLAHGEAGDHEAMWASSLDALGRFPGDGDLFANLCHAGRELGRLRDLVPVALESYPVLRPEPRNIENVTFVLNECDEHRRSTEVVEWWVGRHGQLPVIAMGNAVNAYLKAGRADEGLRWAREYVEADDGATARWFLSYARVESGDLDGALDAARECLERDVEVFMQLADDSDMARLTADPRFGELRDLALAGD